MINLKGTLKLIFCVLCFSACGQDRTSGSRIEVAGIQDGKSILDALENLLRPGLPHRGLGTAEFDVVTSDTYCSLVAWFGENAAGKRTVFLKVTKDGYPIRKNSSRLVARALEVIENASGQTLKGPELGKFQINVVNRVTEYGRTFTKLEKLVIEFNAPGKLKRVYMPPSPNGRPEVECLGAFYSRIR